ncbi:MAG: DNA polymerase domain-containing protein, partial [Desulfurococcaceae archaeon]
MIYIVDINSLYPHIIISHNISADTLVGYISGENHMLLKKLLNIDSELEDFYQKFAPARTSGRYFGLLYAFNMFDEIKYNVFEFTTSYETIKLSGRELLDYIEKHNLIATINGALFKSDEIGIWPSIEKELLEKRSYYKQQGDNTKQLAYKILANALYGVYGTTGFIGFNPYIAEAITITGQFITIALSSFINQKMLDKPYSLNLQDFVNAIRQFNKKDRFLLYRDTDSLFFYNLKPDFDFVSYIAEVGRYLLEVSTLKNAINKDFYLQYSPKVKLEFIGDVAIFVGKKKRYFIYNSKEDTYKVAGFINSSYPQVLNDLIIK